MIPAAAGAAVRPPDCLLTRLYRILPGMSIVFVGKGVGAASQGHENEAGKMFCGRAECGIFY